VSIELIDLNDNLRLKQLSNATLPNPIPNLDAGRARFG